MYYVRKLSKKTTLEKLQTITESEDLQSDLLSQEFKTQKNTLSFWKSSTFDIQTEPCKDAIKATVLASNSLEDTRFLIVDDEQLQSGDIGTDDNLDGVSTAYKNREELHTNFNNLTYGKMGKIISMLINAANDATRIVDLKKDDIGKLILEVKRANLLDESKLNPELKDDIAKWEKKQERDTA